MTTEVLLVGGAIGYFSTRYAWWRSPVSWNAPRVLMYHMVCEHRQGTRFNKLRVLPTSFAKQIQWLRDHDFQFLFASELFGDQPVANRSVCITFDDGYRDNLVHADPILKRFDAKATLYLVTDRDTPWSSKKKMHHDDSELQSEPKLSDQDVRTMLGSGRWQLGGHTRTHANLKSLTAEEAQAEIGSSFEDFGSRFGVVPATFAYPFGIYDRDHTAMVQRAGYLGAVTTEPGIASLPLDDPNQVPRIKVSGTDNLLGFALRIRGGKRGLLK